ncbi:TetR/AcrR family transcriptional regulator [Gandjariella thermophila]|uniref:TetR family transcriptional regulator n=1 Tax=Gandjariella thermophila TaxID=1931992 RepID=A0A4D4J8V2_9PSEU|nr:TetR/AcrR family transcriptional regulator [Gandjariella thermophila]GDY30839.1 TetR family transcriptional regulator [Gandjariella thermophila]
MRRRQEERSQATRAALVGHARRLFAERGYAAVPADEVVAAAGVTRGALYHHYGDKQGLFRAVFEEIEREVTEQVAEAIVGEDDLWQVMLRGLAAFLDACERPEVVRIGLTDAPAVLGWQTWREIEAEHGLGLIIALLERAINEGVIAPQPVPVLAQIVLGALIEAALLIAAAEDRQAARAAAERSVQTLVSGLLVDSAARGAEAPGGRPTQ